MYLDIETGFKRCLDFGVADFVIEKSSFFVLNVFSEVKITKCDIINNIIPKWDNIFLTI